MKEIIFVTPNLANGGAERVTAVLASELAERGNRVIVAYMKDRKQVYETGDLVQTKYLFPRRRGKLYRTAGKIWNLRRLIKKHPQATVVAMLPYETLYTFLASFGQRRRIIYSLRNDPAQMKGKLERFIGNVIYPTAGTIVFQTREAKAFFGTRLRNKGVVIPNPVRQDLPKRFDGKRKREIAAVGRLVPQKNYPLLLRAFAGIHMDYPDWKLKIYGEGSLKNDLEHLCRELSLEKAVGFCGFVPDPADRINESGMFVMSSDYEGISNAMLEALGSGVPCICTDCPAGGTRTFIQHKKNGLLVPVGDCSALRAAMEKLIKQPEFAEKLSREAVKIRQRLSVNAIADEWEKIL